MLVYVCNVQEFVDECTLLVYSTSTLANISMLEVQTFGVRWGSDRQEKTGGERLSLCTWGESSSSELTGTLSYRLESEMCLIFGSFCEDCFFYFKTTCTWKTTVLSDILCACLYYVVLINVFIKITFSKLPKAFFLLFFFAECVVEHKQPTHFSWENEVESI